MNATTPQTEEHPETVECGGLIWTKSDSLNKTKYDAIQPGVGYFYVSQYTEEDGYHRGQWHWMVRFNDWLDPSFKPVALDLNSSGIEPERDDAMMACINANARFVDEIKMVLVLLNVGHYAEGFRAGQEDIKAKIAEVVR